MHDSNELIAMPIPAMPILDSNASEILTIAQMIGPIVSEMRNK
jgi:hypothetical protein